MTVPYATIDDPTFDLLSAVADPHPVVGADAPEIFLAACRADADAQGGIVSVLRVRRLLDGEIPPRRLSALWGHSTGAGKPMVRTGEYEADDHVTKRNGNKVYPLRRFVANQTPRLCPSRGRPGRDGPDTRTERRAWCGPAAGRV